VNDGYFHSDWLGDDNDDGKQPDGSFAITIHDEPRPLSDMSMAQMNEFDELLHWDADLHKSFELDSMMQQNARYRDMASDGNGLGNWNIYPPNSF
jgi:hypothetical protein